MYYNPAMAPPPRSQNQMPWRFQQNMTKPVFNANYPPPMKPFINREAQPFRRYSAGAPPIQQPVQRRAQPLAAVQNSQEMRKNTKRKDTIEEQRNPRKVYQQNGRQNSYVGQNKYNTTVQAVQATYNFYPGMKEVPQWLKGLRLHKYTKLFEEMTYDQMLSLDDSTLTKFQVTKGARKKILQSLEKLQDRAQVIKGLEKCIDENGDVRCLIIELSSILNTPFAQFKAPIHSKQANYLVDAIGYLASEIPDENLPGHISRLVVRLHDHLFRNGQPQIRFLDFEDEYFIKLLQIYEKILSNEAFTMRQKYVINECRQVLLCFTHERKIKANTQKQYVNGNRRNSDPRGPESNSEDSGVESISNNVGNSGSPLARSPQLFAARSAPNSPAPQSASPDSVRPPQAFHHSQYGQQQNSWYNTDSSCSSSTSYSSHAPTPLTANNSPQRQRWEPQQQQKVFLDQEKTALLNMISNNPYLYNYLVSQLPKQPYPRNVQQQSPTSNVSKHIPERAMAYLYPPRSEVEAMNFNGPLTDAEKLRFIAESSESPDLLNRALNMAMGHLNLYEKESQQRFEKPAPLITEWPLQADLYHANQSYEPLSSALLSLGSSAKSLDDQFKTVPPPPLHRSNEYESLRVSEEVENPLHRLLNGADSFYSTSTTHLNMVNTINTESTGQNSSTEFRSVLADTILSTQEDGYRMSPLFQAFRPLTCNAGGAVH